MPPATECRCTAISYCPRTHGIIDVTIKVVERAHCFQIAVNRPTQVGLPFWFGPSSIAPMALLTQSLALLCSFLLALPSGWCCIVGAPCGHQRRPVEKRVDQAPPLRHKCCCHQPSEQKYNDTTPAPKPTTPVMVCSCEKARAVGPEVARLGPDLFVAPLATPADLPPSNAGDQSDLCRIFDPPSPSLHVSHCVWLC